MSNQYGQAFTVDQTADGSKVTYIQFIDPSQAIVYENQEEYYETKDELEESADGIIEDSYISGDDELNVEQYEVLEEVFVEPKKSKSVVSDVQQVTKRLVRKKKDTGKQKGRRRVIPDQTRAIRKIRANTNQAYVNAKGQEVKPKEFDETFKCTCPKKCTDPSRLPLKTRRQLFQMFWNIGSYEGRCAFINSTVNELPKKRCYTKNGEASRRKMTRKYFLKGQEVCKTTFTKTLMISNSRIDVSLHKMEAESFKDERGKGRIGGGFSDEKKEKVIQHIKDNYKHNCSLRGLWVAYQAEHYDDTVSESYYKRMFYENFNLKIHRSFKKEIKLEESD